MGKTLRFILFFLIFNNVITKSQSLHYTGIFPTIDHSGDISNKLGYGLYYFGAFPLINFNKPDISKDYNFLLSQKFYSFSTFLLRYSHYLNI